MNFPMIMYILGMVLKYEGIFMLIPFITGLIYKENAGFSFAVVGLTSYVSGYLLTRKKPQNQLYFAREGFACVALSWIVMSIVGAMPFVLNKDIPNFIDALFETTSGFTTTGASILSDIEALNKSSIMWRSFTHWIGGMGVFVFILAVLPMAGGYSMYLMSAESPGPTVGKLLPRLRDTAKILYMIYFVMTLLQIIILLIFKMPFFDALTITFGTAGTGGFGVKNDSMAGYSIPIQTTVTIFMILFGVNFNAYYLLLGKNKGDAFKMEEVRWYFLIIFLSIAIITLNIVKQYSGPVEALRHCAFQVGSIITTTGYSTVDFNLWPQLSRTILVMLMFIGACAGSTGGGIKVSRIIMLFKMVGVEMTKIIYPRSAKFVRMDKNVVDDDTVKTVAAYLITYVLIFGVSMFILAFDNLDMVTNFTGIAATLNNIGPGLELVGPSGNFSVFTPVSKLVLIFDMLAGRLELFPLLLLFSPSIWVFKHYKKKNYALKK